MIILANENTQRYSLGSNAFGQFSSNNENTFVVSGSGKINDFSDSNASIPDFVKTKIEYLIFEEGITHIGDYAFYKCTNLKTIVFSSTIISIGKMAFGLCSSLMAIDLPDNIEEIEEMAFFSCSSLNGISLSKSLRDINESTFSHCTELDSIVIPSNIKVIGTAAFYECESLDTIVLEDGVQEIGSWAFCGCCFEEFDCPRSVLKLSSNSFGTKCTGNIIINNPGCDLSEFSGSNNITGWIDSTADEYASGTDDRTFDPLNFATASIITPPKKTIFKQDEPLNFDGLKIEITYYSETDEIVRIEDITDYTIELEEIDIEFIGTKRVPITCEKYGTTFSLYFDVKITESDYTPNLTEIFIKKYPNRIKTYDGKPFDLTGLEVYGNFSDGSETEISDYTIDNANSSEVGTHRLTVKYEDFSCYFDVYIMQNKDTDDIDNKISNINPDPILVLGKKHGEKLGVLPATNIVYKYHFNSYDEISFSVNKYNDGEKCPLWDEITDFKTIWFKDKDIWFEIYVECNEEDSTIKNVTGVSIGEAELSQILLYNIEINTEDDIARDDYKITVLFDRNNEENSLLHRITDKASHYKIAHVDASLMKIQRTFSFDNISIYDALQEISEEINCIFIIGSGTNSYGMIERTISAYDLEYYCLYCGNRYEISDINTHGTEGSSVGCIGKVEDLVHPYGEYTSIFIDKDNLAENITFSTDKDSVKNCFRLVAGDDLMTATIRNYNLSGSNYLWYFSDEIKKDLPIELSNKIDAYNDKWNQYYSHNEEFSIGTVDENIYNKFKALCEKYPHNIKPWEYENEIKSYSDLLSSYYELIDFSLYLKSEMMPAVEITESTIHEEMEKAKYISNIRVAVTNLPNASVSTVNAAIRQTVETLVRSEYKVTVSSESYSQNGSIGNWTGYIKLTSTYEDKDGKKLTETSDLIHIIITGNYETFIKQKIDIVLHGKNEDESYDLSSLFSLSISRFQAELKKYCLQRLKSFSDACDSVLNMMIEQGIPDQSQNIGYRESIYKNIYLDYYDKSSILKAEIKVRDSEIQLIEGIYDSDNNITTDGMLTECDKIKNSVQSELDFENFITDNGENPDLWNTLLSYRREDTYQNDNYISDGLSNRELLEYAEDFMKQARRQIYRSAALQHSISSTLKNLLIMPEFAPLLSSFEGGNWLKVKTDDKIYSLRLIGYEIDYDNLEDISVEFSDIRKIGDAIDTLQSILNQANSLSSSYSAISRQAAKAEDAKRAIDSIATNGLALTKTKIIDNAENQNMVMGDDGLLFREYLPITDNYDDKQLKIINKGIYLTDDAWKSSRTGIGNFFYYDPDLGKEIETYGVVADTLVSSLVLSEKVKIYNRNLSTIIDEDGITMKGIKNNVYFNPNNTSIIRITKKEFGGKEDNLMYVDNEGNLCVKGKVTANALILSSEAEESVTNTVSTGIFPNGFSQSVFDELTDGGRIHGFFAQGDQAYLNATYIQTGVLAGPDGMNGNYWDLESGKLVLHSSNITIDNKQFDDFLQESKDMTMILTNDTIVIPVDHNGNYDTFPSGIKTTATVLYGTTDITQQCEFTINVFGLQGVWDVLNQTYSVSALTAEEGWVDITATYLNSFTTTKRFTVSKIKGGETGYFYELEATSQTITLDEDGNSPVDSVKFSAYVRGASSVARKPYTGKFVIENQTTSGDWITVYSSYPLEEYVDFKFNYSHTESTFLTDENDYIIWDSSEIGLLTQPNVVREGLIDYTHLRCTLYAAEDTDGTIILSRKTIDFVKHAKKLTQTDVFNILTDNGKIEGIYMQGGNLYINASYIEGGTLKLGKHNDNGGVFEVYDDNNIRYLLANKNGLRTLDTNGNRQVLITRNGIHVAQGSNNPAIDYMKITSTGMRFYDTDGTTSNISITPTSGITAIKGKIGSFYLDEDGLTYGNPKHIINTSAQNIYIGTNGIVVGSSTVNTQLNSGSMTFAYNGTSIASIKAGNIDVTLPGTGAITSNRVNSLVISGYTTFDDTVVMKKEVYASQGLSTTDLSTEGVTALNGVIYLSGALYVDRTQAKTISHDFYLACGYEQDGRAANWVGPFRLKNGILCYMGQ